MAEHGKLSDPQYQERRRQSQRRRERQRHDDLCALMGQEWGRRLVYWLIWGDPCDQRPSEYLGRLTSDVFDTGIKDGLCSALLAARVDGARAAAIEFHNLIERATPELFVRMVGEQLESRARDLALDSADEEDTDHG
jgi:hypothetical protein